MEAVGKYFYCADPEQVSESLSANLARHRLLQGVTRLGLAVSGGADSVALFHLMLPVCRESGVAITVLHLNHGLRAEAEADARFVLALAETAGVPLLAENVSVAATRRGGTSLEMAAREARLAFFRRCCASAGLDAIATGHQADDVAESLLLRLARGAGSTGLSGLRPLSKIALPDDASGAPRAHLTLVRPLLSLSGAALRAWLNQRKLAWCEDASNRDCSIPRNRVRHGVLPHLEAAWMPDLRARLCQSAEALREDDALLDALATRQLDSISPDTHDGASPLPAEALCQQPTALQRRMLRLWLFRQGLPEAAGLTTILALLERCCSAEEWKFQLSGGTLARCSRGQLSIVRTDMFLPAEREVIDSARFTWGSVAVHAEQDRGVLGVADGIGTYPAVCTLDADRLKGKRLLIRTRQPGDRIAPTGLTGSKKLQDLFVDAKIPEHLRDAIPIFSCDSEIVWIPGYRISRHFAVPSPDAPCLRITVEQASSPAPARAGQEPLAKWTGEDACPTV